MQHEKILILDFGAQYTQLIARRVREAHVYCEIHPYDADEKFIRAFNPRGIILSGSHLSAYDAAAGTPGCWTVSRISAPQKGTDCSRCG